MGRKIDMKKIDDVTKCQVTFSKRRSSLMKKANEIAVCCDIDVAFVAFSPSGRVSKFCNKKRIEEVLHRYVNLPAETRLDHINNLENKLEKLRHLDHIKSDTNKLQYLDKQIENLELQIKKSGLELQILEADLRDYELDPEQEPSLHQLSWCERNINHSLERTIARKSALFGNLTTSRLQPNFQNQDDALFSSIFNENELNLPAQNPSTGQILMKLDPWISPYSAKVCDNIIQDLLDQTNFAPNMNPGPSNISSLPIASNICNFSLSPIILESGIMVTSNADIPSLQIPQQQQFVVDQTLLDFPQQSTINAWNNFSSATLSNAIQSSTQSLCTIQPSRFSSTTIVTSNASDVMMPQQTIQNSLQYTTLNSSQFTNMEGGEIGHDNMGNYGNNVRNNNADEEDLCRIGCNNMHRSHRSEAPFRVQKEVCQGILLNNPQQEDGFGDNTLWASKVQKSNLWEWEDLLLDENFNVGGFSK